MLKMLVAAYFILITATVTNGQRLLLTPSRDHTVTIPGGNAAFSCYATNGNLTGIQWLLNGTGLDELDLAGIEVHREVMDYGVGLEGGLTLRRISVGWNQTAVKCVGSFDNGAELLSGTSTLLLQGVLDAVGSLSVRALNSSLLLNWTAPFSLQFPIAEPQMTYCVEVVNTYHHSTLLSPSLLRSECGITETQYAFVPAFAPSMCDQLEFSVTPVNMAGNGTIAVIRGLSSDSSLIVQTPSSFSGESVLSSVESGLFEFQVNMSTLVLKCSAELTDTLSHTRYHFNDSNGLHCHRNDNSSHLSLSTSALPTNRLFEATFITTNCLGSTRSHLTLSTYDVQKITFAPCANDTNGCIGFTITLSTGSQAQGVLMAILLRDDREEPNSHSERNVYLLLKKSVAGSFIEVRGMAAGVYDVFLYDIEWNGFVNPGPPAVRGSVSVAQSQDIEQQPLSTNRTTQCSVTQLNSTITVTCDRAPTTSSGFLSVLQDVSHMDHLLTAQVLGEAADLSFRAVPPGRYVLTVLPLLQDLPACSLPSSSRTKSRCVIHTELVLISTDISGTQAVASPSQLPPTVWVNIVCSASFLILGAVLGLLLFALACWCRRKWRKVRGQGRSSLYREGGSKTMESPVYEDIGPQVVNRVHYMLEQNEAYGHVN